MIQCKKSALRGYSTTKNRSVIHSKMRWNNMTNKRFLLVASVSTDNPKAIRSSLEKLIGRHGSVKEVSTDGVDQKGKGEFLVQAEIEGISAKDLNRSLLSALRRVEKRTRLRAEWSSGNTTERYFDYVLKTTIKK
jgi:hypothetical protein